MTNEEFNEKLILFEYENYSEKEYKPISYSKFVTQKLIEARIELSKLHQPTVIKSVCENCKTEQKEDGHKWCFSCLKKHGFKD